MSINVAVIGSGLSAYGVLRYLLDQEDISVTLYDIGLTSNDHYVNTSVLPNQVSSSCQQYVYGAHDLASPLGIVTERICSSHALGGFSSVYSGAAILPSRQELSEWPLSSLPSTYDIKSILDGMTILPSTNQFTKQFPLATIPASFFPNTSKSYTTLGYSSLLADKYSSKRLIQPFNPTSYILNMSRDARISYISQRYVHSFIPVGDKVSLLMSTRSGNPVVPPYLSEVSFNAIFLCAGAVSTTAIVSQSLNNLYPNKLSCTQSLPLQVAPFSVIPLLRLFTPYRAFAEASLTRTDAPWYFLEHASPLTYCKNTHTQIAPLFSEKRFQTSASHQHYSLLGKLFKPILSRLFYALTVYSSSTSKSSHTITTSTDHPSRAVQIRESKNSPPFRSFLSVYFSILSKTLETGLLPLPLFPILQPLFLKTNLGGWHYGSTLPMSNEDTSDLPRTTFDGQLHGVPGVYVCDASCLPTIPGCTVALLTMSNAHRIARTWHEKTKNAC